MAIPPGVKDLPKIVCVKCMKRKLPYIRHPKLRFEPESWQVGAKDYFVKVNCTYHGTTGIYAPFHLFKKDAWGKPTVIAVFINAKEPPHYYFWPPLWAMQ